MGVYEKATRRAWWLQGPVALRELLGVPLLRGDSCALHPGTGTHDSESDRRAPAPTPTPGKAVCMVLSIKIHQNQGLRAECRVSDGCRRFSRKSRQAHGGVPSGAGAGENATSRIR